MITLRDQLMESVLLISLVFCVVFVFVLCLVSLDCLILIAIVLCLVPNDVCVVGLSDLDCHRSVSCT
jgi:hypothetical protein